MMPRCCLLLLLLVQTIVVLVQSHDDDPLPPDTKILGGFEINITEVPWQVCIQIDGGHHCGGVIISDRWILSAAHCTKGFSGFKLMIGSSLFQNETGLYDVELVVNHDKYGMYVNDISALRLSRPLEFGATVKAVRLPEAGATRPPVNTELRVSGWGSIEGGENPTTLRAVDVKLVDFKNCKRGSIGAKATQVCAGGRHKDACGGDSGGPLVNGDLLVGLVSYGPECESKEYSYGTYTDVTAYRDWISNVTGI